MPTSPTRAALSLQVAGGIGGLLARSVNPQMLDASTQPQAHAYYHCDGNGNIGALVNTNQTVVAKYSYDPYGNLLGMSGLLAKANTYRFSSKEYQGNAGLYYYGFRYYESNLQRWLNRDPIQENGGINLFGFVRNAPPSSIDPYGLVLKIDPTSSPDFQKRMLECLRELINKSPYGLDLVRESIDSPQTIKITPFDGGAACGGSVRSTDPEDQNPAIGMHPTSPNGASPKQQRGMEKCGEACPKNIAGCAIVLAHELGHALYDYSEAQAVVYAENPVRRDFGVPLRTTYHCKRVYPPDSITRRSGK